MLLRRFATAFAIRFAARESNAGAGSLEQALIATGLTLAATKQRRTLGLALLAGAGALALQRRRATPPRP